MDTKFYSPPKITPKEVLLVGFDGGFSRLLEGAENAHRDYHFREFHQSFHLHRWMDRVFKLMPVDNQPIGLICDFEFLKADNFRLIHALRRNEALRKLPVIVITQGDEDCQRLAMEGGADDCYQAPVRWEELQSQIMFLHELKHQVEEPVISTETYRIPRGKRLFDIVFASAVLIASSPFWITIAALVKLTSKGPIIYKSKRVGTGYQVFDFLKFRSMVQDADAQRDAMRELNNYAGEDKGQQVFLKVKNDPRVTRIGKIIRKTSLDELPQMLNVLRGDMSIVGNRPLPLDEAECLTSDAWSARFLAPAGITGLWQTCPEGKDNLPPEQRIALDIQYAETLSAMTDLKIISKTLPAMIQRNE